MTFRSRTIYIVTSSLWMERIFGLSASETGWTTIAIVIGEVIGLLSLQIFGHRIKLYKSAIICLFNQLFIGGLPLFLLSYFYGRVSYILIFPSKYLVIISIKL